MQEIKDERKWKRTVGVRYENLEESIYQIALPITGRVIGALKKPLHDICWTLRAILVKQEILMEMSQQIDERMKICSELKERIEFREFVSTEAGSAGLAELKTQYEREERAIEQISNRMQRIEVGVLVFDEQFQNWYLQENGNG